MGIKISKLSKKNKNKDNNQIMLNYTNRDTIKKFENLVMFKLKTKLMEMYEEPFKSVHYHMMKNGNQFTYQKSLFTTKKPERTNPGN